MGVISHENSFAKGLLDSLSLPAFLLRLDVFLKEALSSARSDGGHAGIMGWISVLCKMLDEPVVMVPFWPSRI